MDYKEFKHIHFMHEKYDDGSQESADVLHSLESEFPDFYAQLVIESEQRRVTPN